MTQDHPAHATIAVEVKGVQYYVHANGTVERSSRGQRTTVKGGIAHAQAVRMAASRRALRISAWERDQRTAKK